MNIVANVIKTPDGVILHSKYTHDYVSTEDKNGNYYACDGGNSYLKRNFTVKDYIELSIYDESPFKLQRLYVKFLVNDYWLTLSEMPVDLLKAIINGMIEKNVKWDDFKLNLFIKEFKLKGGKL